MDGKKITIGLLVGTFVAVGLIFWIGLSGGGTAGRADAASSGRVTPPPRRGVPHANAHAAPAAKAAPSADRGDGGSATVIAPDGPDDAGP